MVNGGSGSAIGIHVCRAMRGGRLGGKTFHLKRAGGQKTSWPAFGQNERLASRQADRRKAAWATTQESRSMPGHRHAIQHAPKPRIRAVLRPGRQGHLTYPLGPLRGACGGDGERGSLSADNGAFGVQAGDLQQPGHDRSGADEFRLV
jgi:hypothetical protein